MTIAVCVMSAPRGGNGIQALRRASEQACAILHASIEPESVERVLLSEGGAEEMTAQAKPDAFRPNSTPEGNAVQVHPRDPDVPFL